MTHPVVRSRRQPQQPLPPMRERIAALKYVVPLLRMVWNTHRGYAFTIFLLRVTRSFVPVATLWIGKLIIDGVIAAARGAGPARHVFVLIAVEFGIVMFGAALSRAAVVEQILGELFSNKMSIDLMEHAATLDLQMFEDAKFYDQME